MLSFGYDLDEVKVDKFPTEDSTNQISGPMISGMIDCREGLEVESDFVIQDGAFSFMATPFRLVRLFLPRREPAQELMRRKLQTLLELLNPFTNALQGTQVYLTLGHDNASGLITLQDDFPVLEMREVERTSSLTRAKKVLTAMTHALGGTYLESWFKVTVHPVGGLVMARDGTGLTGSVNDTGKLFSGDGREVHEGLCVVDGSVVSRSLGANPFATITALAERSVELVARKQGLVLDLLSSTPIGPCKSKATTPSATFSERMTGGICFEGETRPCTMYVDVKVTRRRKAEGFVGRLSGTVCSPHLSAEQLMITEGELSLPSRPIGTRSTTDEVPLCSHRHKWRWLLHLRKEASETVCHTFRCTSVGSNNHPGPRG